ncbi:MAG: ligase-associated DNA damage response exonuclease [Cyanobacteria bacterium TGS_CYA1]|nr:ligase-associated DNA damage response exonuclease [Cyanobacteria bacterium TGS_CYA1]
MSDSNNLIYPTDKGLYCQAADVYVDPWGKVERAIITHAHSDHARWGSQNYLCAEPGEKVLRYRLQNAPNVESMPYGKTIERNGVKISLHPAGHILGSAQARFEYKGEVWVVSGDYKLNPDPTCALFEPVKCDTFITESTFGLPIYKWPEHEELFEDINSWWYKNKSEGRNSLILCYALGKAQRILAGLDTSIGPVYTHGAVEVLTEIYRQSGLNLPATIKIQAGVKLEPGSIILAPPSVQNSPWQRKLQPVSVAFASGWMQVRGIRRRRSFDKGFILSDHCDWNSLLTAVKESEASQVLVTHGYADVFSRYLQTEMGIASSILSTHFAGESVMEQEEVLEEVSEVIEETE